MPMTCHETSDSGLLTASHHSSNAVIHVQPRLLPERRSAPSSSADVLGAPRSTKLEFS